MHCASCGAENNNDHRFCSGCGAQLKLVCESCGHDNAAGGKFCVNCGNPLSNTERAAQATAGTESAERRQITVMFCDLVGSTELSGRIDPEDLSELYRAYRAVSEEVIHAHGGYVAEYLGDGIVTYFGYPVALENAAERCVRAALATIDAIQAAEFAALPDVKLAARIGVATGLVVAGDLLGASDRSQVRTVIGETPNLAARLQALAPVNAVVVGENTRRLLADQFRLEAMDVVQLKGIQGAVTPYLVRGLAAASDRQVANDQDRALIGRERELAVFSERWSEVANGSSATLLVNGEPGIGKSRLVRAFDARLENVAHTSFWLQGSSFYQNTAFHPVIELLRRTFNRNDEPAISRLEVALAEAGQPTAQSLPLICELLSIPFDGEDPNVGLSAEARRRQTLLTLKNWLLGASQNQPILLIAEDLHWVDPSTLELLELLVAESQDARLLIVATHRPEFESDWGALPQVTSLTLEPLKPAEIAQLARNVVTEVGLPAAMLEMVIAKTDGVPLFVEELTKSVAELGFAQAAEGGELESDFAIPTTLQDSLMARLDRLGEAREIAQLAAVIGREFSFEMVAAVLSDRSQGELERLLASLVDAQLAFQVGLPPNATYSFKHALIQDAAYQSLLRRRRQTLHQDLAGVLEASFPQVCLREPELLAQHYALGGKIEEAIDYYLRAAHFAQQRSALKEAVNHVKSGIHWLAEAGAGESRDRLELSLLIALTGPLIATEGYANPEVERTCGRALELCDSVGSGEDLPFALYGLTTYYLNSSNLPRCREVSEKLLELSREAPYAEHEAAAHLQLGFVSLFSGDLEQALAELKANMQIYDRRIHSVPAARYGQDPGATAYAQGSMVAWQLGYADLGVEYGRKGIALSQEFDDPFTEAVARVFLTLTHISRRERQTALDLAEETIELCERQNFPQWLHQARVTRGWALADGSDTTAEGLAEVRAALADLASVSAVIGAPIFMTLLVESLMAASATDAALATVERALADSAVRGNRWVDAELLRLQALLLADGGGADPSVVRATLDRSLAEARRTASRLYEVRSLCTAHDLELATRDDYARMSTLHGQLSEGLRTHDYLAMEDALQSVTTP